MKILIQNGTWALRKLIILSILRTIHRLQSGKIHKSEVCIRNNNLLPLLLPAQIVKRSAGLLMCCYDFKSFQFKRKDLKFFEHEWTQHRKIRRSEGRSASSEAACAGLVLVVTGEIWIVLLQEKLDFFQPINTVCRHFNELFCCRNVADPEMSSA